MSWAGFAAIFALFFVTHSVPVRPGVKSRITSRIGARGFSFFYSVMSLVMLGVLIWAAGQAPEIWLWPQLAWHRWVIQAGMLVVCLLLALSIARPNPLSFGGGDNKRFDPNRPGIVRVARHPILIALSLWSGLHLLANGDLAHVLLFGILGAFAVAGQKLVDRRKRRQLGPDRWHGLTTAIASAPLISRPTSWGGAAIRVVTGLTAYGALLWAHPFVIGVAAL